MSSPKHLHYMGTNRASSHCTPRSIVNHLGLKFTAKSLELRTKPVSEPACEFLRGVRDPQRVVDPARPGSGSVGATFAAVGSGPSQEPAPQSNADRSARKDLQKKLALLRHGPNRAATATTRKRLNLIHRMWIGGECRRNSHARGIRARTAAVRRPATGLPPRSPVPQALRTRGSRHGPPAAGRGTADQARKPATPAGQGDSAPGSGQAARQAASRCEMPTAGRGRKHSPIPQLKFNERFHNILFQKGLRRL